VPNPFRISLLGMGIHAWLIPAGAAGRGPALFTVAQGKNMWQLAACKPVFNVLVNDAMDQMRIVLRECVEIFRICSLVDVTGAKS
jgi:hypothetical protein